MKLVYKEGNFVEYFPRIQAMFKEHWSELGCMGGPETLELNGPYYIACQVAGTLVTTGIEDEDTGEIVGYTTTSLYYPPHHKSTLFALCDCFYVKPEYRKGMMGAKLIRFTEKLLKDKYNVEYFQFGMNTQKDISKLLTRFGYTISDIVYIKEI